MTVFDNNSATTSNEAALSVTRSLPQHNMTMTLDAENICPSHPTSDHAPTKVCASSGNVRSVHAASLCMHRSETLHSPTRPINGLLPPFSSRNVHLPTPQRWVYSTYPSTVTLLDDTWYSCSFQDTNFVLTVLVILARMDRQVHGTLLLKAKCEEGILRSRTTS
jgi:hypothetical protein